VEKHLKPFYRAKNKMKTKNFETADLQFALVAFLRKLKRCCYYYQLTSAITEKRAFSAINTKSYILNS